MQNAVSFLGKTYGNDRLRGVTAAIDTALNGRSLDVDTAVVQLTTGPAHLGFWTFDPLPFFTRDRKRFLTTEQTALGAWTRANPLTLSRGGSQYFINYPDAVTRTGKLDYSVSLTSALGKLTQMPHKGGIYNATTHTTAGALLREICGYNGSTPAAGVTLYVAPEFENIVLYGWLPYLSPTGENGAQTGSARDNFAQVLFAINAAVRDDANGVLRVENLPTTAQSTITDDRVYREGAQVRTEQPITAVTLLEHNYVVGSDTETLFEGTASAGQIIIFSGPMADLSWHTAAEPPVEMPITTRHANYCVLSAGNGVLTGTPYLDTTREITRSVSQSDTPNTERVENATLVSLYNVSDCADKLADYYAHRTWIECDAIIEMEDAGDVVSLYDPFDEVQRSACIEAISPLIVSKVMKGRVSALVGYTPWQTVAFTDVHQILTASGTFTVPAGVTSITLVLIGAGGGGQGGTNGEAGESVSGEWTNYRGGINLDVAPGKGGAAGVGGVAGAAGKVLILELTVTPGQTFAWSCGAKGVGGSNGAMGTAGGETTFGAYSTASGSIFSLGYTDPYDGTTYARGGTDGVDGAKGGDGATVNRNEATNGKPGGDVGTHTGGEGGVGIWTLVYISDNWTQSKSGAGGGGASADGDGITPATPTFAPGAEQYGANGGAGANATAPANASTYGSAGSGGNGGGGGGGAGGWHLNEQQGSDLPRTVTFTANGGAAGAGAKGSDGAAGCIIAAYRVPA